MKNLLLALLVAGPALDSLGQGRLNLVNSYGSPAVVVPIFAPDGSILGSQADKARYRVEVFTYDVSKPGGFGIQVGATVGAPNGPSLAATGRFNAGSGVPIPGVAPGQPAILIVRAWDAGLDGSIPWEECWWRSWGAITRSFETGPTGGEGDPPSPPKPMLTSEFQMVHTLPTPEPSTCVLTALGVVALLLLRRRRGVN